MLALLLAKQAWVSASLSPRAPAPNHLSAHSSLSAPVHHWAHSSLSASLMLLTPALFPTSTPEPDTYPQPGTGHLVPFVSSPAVLSHSFPHAMPRKAPLALPAPPNISIAQELQTLTGEIFLPEQAAAFAGVLQVPGRTWLSGPWWLHGRTDGCTRMCSRTELLQIHNRRAPGLGRTWSQCLDVWQRLPPRQSWVPCPMEASRSVQGGCNSCAFGRNHWSTLVFGEWPCLLGWVSLGRSGGGSHLLVQYISSSWLCRGWVEAGVLSNPLLQSHHPFRGLTDRMRRQMLSHTLTFTVRWRSSAEVHHPGLGRLRRRLTLGPWRRGLSWLCCSKCCRATLRPAAHSGRVFSVPLELCP